MNYIKETQAIYGVIALTLGMLAALGIGFGSIKRKNKKLKITVSVLFTILLVANIIQIQKVQAEVEHMKFIEQKEKFYSTYFENLETKLEVEHGEEVEFDVGELEVVNEVEVDTKELGTHEVELELKDEDDYELVKEYTVIVKDTKAPVISGHKNHTIIEGDSVDYKKGVKAVDEVDGEVKVKFSGDVDTNKPGTYEVKITAEDKSGNKATEKLTVTVKAKPKPKPQPKPQAPSNTGSGSSNTGSSQSSQPKPSNSGYRREAWMWQLINSYPEPARRGLKGATIVDSLGGNYAGMTYSSSMTIKVANWIKDNTFRGSVAHEIGHIYHLRTGADQTAEWREIYQAEWAGKGHYGSNNVMEAFAETFKTMHEPGSWNARPASQIPRSIQYMRNLINSGV